MARGPRRGCRSAQRAAGRYRQLFDRAGWQAARAADRCVSGLHGPRLHRRAHQVRRRGPRQRRDVPAHLRASLGQLGRRPQYPAVLGHAQGRRPWRARRTIDHARRRHHRTDVLAGFEDPGVFGSAQAGRALVHQLRYLHGRSRRQRRAKQPHGHEPGLGCRPAVLAGRQDPVLPCDEAPRFRGRPLRRRGSGPRQGLQAGNRRHLGSFGRRATGFAGRQDALHHGRRPRPASALCGGRRQPAHQRPEQGWFGRRFRRGHRANRADDG